MEIESPAIAPFILLNSQTIILIIKNLFMKKVKLSLFVALAILGASVTAFTGKTNITPGWYGQPSDAVPPYNTSSPISSADLSTKCPTGTAHLCAAYLDVNGNLDASKSPNTVMSDFNFRP
jgi:hypothetical protein